MKANSGKTALMRVVMVGCALFLAPAVWGQTGSFTGTIMDASDSTPLSGAKVILSTGAIGGQAVDTAVTSVNGLYRFDSLATGKKSRYTLSVSDSGYVSAYQSNLTLNASQVDTVDFYLSADTGGTVTPPAAGTFTGTILDSDSNALAGAMVILSEAGGILGVALDTAWTGVNGGYTFPNVQVGIRRQFSITASLAGYASETATRLLLDSGQVDTVDLYLSAMVDSLSWVVTGKVTADSAKGMGLSGVTVQFVRRLGTEEIYSGKTDANGMYSILLPQNAAAYQVNTAFSGYQAADSLFQVAADSAMLDLVLKKDSVLTVERLSSASGAVAHLFPNPSKGVATLTILGAQGARFALYSPAGREIYAAKVSGASARISMATGRLPAGLYLWRVKTAGRVEAAGRMLIVR